MRPSTRKALLALASIVALTATACGSSSSKEAAPTTGAASATTAAATTAAPAATTAAPTTMAAMPSSAPAAKVRVVASTSWVAAFAKLAGATDVTYIAPNNVQHPPDYDPKPSDLAKVADADFVLLAGFEGFAQRLKDAAGSKAKVDAVATDFDPAKLGPEVLRLAAELGTDAMTAQHNIEAYTAGYTKASTDLKAKLAGKTQTVVAQAFVANWATFAGFTPVGTYGPQPSTPTQVADLVKLKPTVVFENFHMGGGTEIAAAANAKKIDLINFPGDDLDLTKVISADVERITAALG